MKKSKTQFKKMQQKAKKQSYQAEPMSMEELDDFNFDKALPGGGGKPDKDELEMMRDIMGDDMETDDMG